MGVIYGRRWSPTPGLLSAGREHLLRLGAPKG